MKCPKCGYLGFEEVDRCRNCGYDFSLLSDIPLPELPIRDAVRDGDPLDDLALVDAAGLPGRLLRTREGASPSAELPLFRPPADDAPLITRPSAPRPPLAVRRSTPEAPRLRSDPRTPLLDLSEPPAAGGRASSPSAGEDSGAWGASRTPRVEPAGVLARIAAVVIDLGILTAIDSAVVYFTIQICGLTWADFDLVPKAPLAAFLIVQNGGYLVAFNAGGQTLGKMAAGIRVVSTTGRASVDLGHAVLRTIVWIVLAVPAGLGFATALFSRERRGLHDQFAGTRVIRSTPLA